MAILNKKNKLSITQSIVYGNPHYPVLTEQFNRLKDNLLFLSVDGNNRVIQIESSIAAESKSTIICNLAVCLGKSGKKVCVVDLDFIKARVHRMFKIENSKGLAEYMVGNATKEELIKQTSYQNVSIINRGAEVSNASIILTSEKMKNLIIKLKEEFDYVLLDCAPVLLISDYIHISRFSDGVLFVVAYAKTKKKQVMEALSLLRKNNIPVLGSTFSFFNHKKSSDHTEYDYYKSYGYSYKDK